MSSARASEQRGHNHFWNCVPSAFLLCVSLVAPAQQARSAMAGHLDVDSIIERLMAVKSARPGTCVPIADKEAAALVAAAVPPIIAAIVVAVAARGSG